MEDVKDLLPKDLILSDEGQYRFSLVRVREYAGKRVLWTRAGKLTFVFFLDEESENKRTLHRRATRYVNEKQLREFEDMLLHRKVNRRFQGVIKELLGSQEKEVFDARGNLRDDVVVKKVRVVDMGQLDLKRLVDTVPCEGREGADEETLKEFLSALWRDVPGEKTIRQIATICKRSASTAQKYFEIMNRSIPLVGQKDGRAVLSSVLPASVLEAASCSLVTGASDDQTIS